MDGERFEIFPFHTNFVHSFSGHVFLKFLLLLSNFFFLTLPFHTTFAARKMFINLIRNQESRESGKESEKVKRRKKKIKSWFSARDQLNSLETWYKLLSLSPFLSLPFLPSLQISTPKFPIQCPRFLLLASSVFPHVVSTFLEKRKEGFPSFPFFFFFLIATAVWR